MDEEMDECEVMKKEEEKEERKQKKKRNKKKRKTGEKITVLEPRIGASPPSPAACDGDDDNDDNDDGDDHGRIPISSNLSCLFSERPARARVRGAT